MPDPLIKGARFSLLPAGSGCVPCSLGRQCFSYLTTSCRSRSVPVDCMSFAAHKRHLALFAMANLLPRRMVRTSVVPTSPGRTYSLVGQPDWKRLSVLCAFKVEVASEGLPNSTSHLVKALVTAIHCVAQAAVGSQPADHPAAVRRASSHGQRGGAGRRWHRVGPAGRSAGAGLGVLFLDECAEIGVRTIWTRCALRWRTGKCGQPPPGGHQRLEPAAAVAADPAVQRLP